MRKKIIKNDTIFNHSVNSPLNNQNKEVVRKIIFYSAKVPLIRGST